MRVTLRRPTPLPALLAQLDLHLGRGLEPFRLAPPSAADEVVRLARAAGVAAVPAWLTALYAWRGGQAPGARPLSARPWRLLSVAEATALADGSGLLPIFAGPEGPIAATPDRDAWLAPLAGVRPRDLRLEELLYDGLVGLGWAPDAAHRPPADVRLGAALEALGALAGADPSFVGLHPPASPAARAEVAREVIGGERFPEALEVWWAFADGQPIGAGRRYGAGLHPASGFRALSLMESLGQWRAERASWPIHGLPLFVHPDARVLLFGLDGPGAGRLVELDAADPSRPTSPFASLVEWVHRALEVRRRDLEIEHRAPSGLDLTVAERWVLAVGAILGAANGERLDVLGGGPRHVDARARAAGLARWWGIRTGAELVGKIEHLLAGHEDEAPTDPDAAWDLGRAVAIAGQGFVAGLIEADDAWGLMVRAARAVQAGFSGWDEFGESYCGSRAEWQRELGPSEASRSDAVADVARLLGPGGGWAELPWSVALDAPSPPVAPPIEVRVAGPGDLVGALAAAPEGARLLLAPGTYAGTLRIERSIVLVAAGPGVRLVADGADPAIHVVGAADAFLEGVEIAGAGDAVRIEDGLARLTRCRIEAGRNAVEVFADQIGALVDCDVTAPGGIGGLAHTRAVLTVEGCRFARATTHLQVGADGTLVVTDSTLAGAERHALVSFGGVAEVRGVAASGTGLAAFGAVRGGELRLSEVRVTGCAAGLLTDDGATVTAVASEFRDQRGPHIELGAIRGAHFEGCSLVGSGGSGIWLRPGPSAVFDGCTVAGSALPALLAQGRSDDPAVWIDGRIETPASGTGAAVEVAGGARLNIDGAELRAGRGAAVMVHGEGSLVLIEGAAILDPAEEGLFALDGGTAALVGARIERPGDLAVRAEDADVLLARAEVIDGVSVGVGALGRSYAAILETRLAGQPGAAIEVGGSSSVDLLRVTTARVGEASVLVEDQATVAIVASALAEGTNGAIDRRADAAVTVAAAPPTAELPAPDDDDDALAGARRVLGEDADDRTLAALLARAAEAPRLWALLARLA